MTRTKTLMRRQLLMLFCALLLFGQIFTAQAFADSRRDMNISYTVTEDMLPQASPTPTAKPVATPHPGKGEPPKTGDKSKIMEYALIGAGSLLAALGAFVYLNKNEEDEELKNE